MSGKTQFILGVAPLAKRLRALFIGGPFYQGFGGPGEEDHLLSWIWGARKTFWGFREQGSEETIPGSRGESSFFFQKITPPLVGPLLTSCIWKLMFLAIGHNLIMKICLCNE